MSITAMPLLHNKAEVCARLQISARNLEGMVRGNTFPPPVRIGKCVYWTEKSVTVWMQRMFGVQEAWQQSD